MLSEKTFKSWRIDFGEKVTSSAEAMLKHFRKKLTFYILQSECKRIQGVTRKFVHSNHVMRL